jgi:hypothetical protein
MKYLFQESVEVTPIKANGTKETKCYDTEDKIRLSP